jgi:hypothetical protein
MTAQQAADALRKYALTAPEHIKEPLKMAQEALIDKRSTMCEIMRHKACKCGEVCLYPNEIGINHEASR